MNSEPTQEAIDTVAAIVNITPGASADLLRANGNDVQRAVDSYFENLNQPAPSEAWDTQWNEGQFHGDKNNWEQSQGQVQAQDTGRGESNSFQINASDSLGPNVFVSAPSRPPSRVNHRNAIDSQTGSTKVLSTAEREDDDLQRALALSMGAEGEQETGVIATTESPHFGPATREHYDHKEWGMMAPRSQAYEIVLDPEPSDRKRGIGEPAFLKPTPMAMSLGSLITMLESIPLAREALLLRDRLLPDYGADKQWWEGSAIRISRIVDIGTDPSDIHWEDILYETQRLVAFLGETDRAYGTAAVLAELDGVKGGTPDRRMVNFLQMWQESVKRAVPDTPYATIFKSHAIKSRGDPNIPNEDFEFSLLEVIVEPALADSGMSLYDSLDSIIWADGAALDSSDETYLDSVSDIFTMRITRQDPSRTGTGLKIPSTWYPDRYLAQWKEFAVGLRRKRQEMELTIQKLDEIESKLTKFTLPSSGQSVDPRKLLNVSIDYLEGTRNSRAPTEAIAQSSTPMGLSSMSEASGSTNQLPDLSSDALDNSHVENQLRSILIDVDEKLKSLEKHKEQARQALREWSKILTEDTDSASPRPSHKYSLRGVSTDPYTTYIMKPLVETAENYTLDARARGLQWWKMTYNDTDMSPVNATKVQEIQVLKAAKDEGKNILLVYASQRALHVDGDTTLPKVLENFVRADNLHFEEELSPINLPDSRFSMTPPSEQSSTEVMEPSRPIFKPQAIDPKAVQKDLENDDTELNSMEETATSHRNDAEQHTNSQEMMEVSPSIFATTVMGKTNQKETRYRQHEAPDEDADTMSDEAIVAESNKKITPAAEAW